MYIIVDMDAPEQAYGPYVDINEAVRAIVVFAQQNEWQDTLNALHAMVDVTTYAGPIINDFPIREDAFEIDTDSMTFGFNDVMSEGDVSLQLVMLDAKPFLKRFAADFLVEVRGIPGVDWDASGAGEAIDAYVERWLITAAS